MACLSIVNQVVQQDTTNYISGLFFYLSHKQIYFSLLSVIILISIVQYQRDLQNTLNKQTITTN